MGLLGSGIRQVVDIAAGRDALLSPQESEYLKSQRELQQLLGAKNTELFNYGELAPVKRNKVTGERSLAMTGLFRDAIEAAHNVMQSQRSGIQNPKSLFDIIL